jgi:death-on-curing family protein
LPKNKPTAFKITGAYVEAIHDDFVATHWPANQPVSRHEYRDKNPIESAVNRPFHSFGGIEFYPTIFEKAAPLFHSLVCNHPFANGNKRTAVLSVDLFLLANGIVLALTNKQMYDLAKDTAMHNEKGMDCDRLVAKIAATFSELSVKISDLKNEKGLEEIYTQARTCRRSVRNHPANRQSPIKKDTSN